MRARVLPADEWGRLKGTELEQLAGQLTPASAKMLVVEQDAEIVGCCALALVLHADGLWIAPAHRRCGAVGRHLLRLFYEGAHEFRATAAVAGVESDELADLLRAHLHATVTPPMAHAVIPVGKETYV